MHILTDKRRLIDAIEPPAWGEGVRAWLVRGYLYIRSTHRFSECLTYHRFARFEYVSQWDVDTVRKALPKRRRVRYKRPRIVDGVKKSY